VLESSVQRPVCGQLWRLRLLQSEEVRLRLSLLSQGQAQYLVRGMKNFKGKVSQVYDLKKFVVDRE
jgi:hypothetical protein